MNTNKGEHFQNVGRAFELLGNPLRLQIFLKILAEGCDCDFGDRKGFAGNCVTSIVKNLKIPQSTVSTYIRDLVNGGLVECSRKGRYVYCRPSREMLVSLKSFVDGALGQVRYGK